MAKSVRNGIFGTQEISRDSKFPLRYEIQLGQEIIPPNIFT